MYVPTLGKFVVHSLLNSLFCPFFAQFIIYSDFRSIINFLERNLPTALTQAGKSAYYIFSYDQVPPLHCTSHRCKSIELCEFLKLVCSPNDLNFP